MSGLAALLVVAGIISLVIGLFQKHKLGRIAKAPLRSTGDVASKGGSVAGEKGAVSVEGDVICREPLISPVTGTPCLFYELKVVGEWKEGEQSKSKDYLVEKRAAAFGVDDGTGIVPVAADKGGDYEPYERTFSETKKEGFFADLKNAIGKKEPIIFGKYAFENPPMSKADKFTCTEYVMKLQPRLFVLGKHDSGVIAPPSWTSLILSNKSRDALLGSTAKAAKGFLIGGGSATGAGVVFAVIAALIAPKSPKAAPAAGAPTAAVVAPAALPAPDAKGPASTEDCARLTDAFFKGVKIKPAKRQREIQKCTQEMTTGQVNCFISAKTPDDLKACKQ